MAEGATERDDPDARGGVGDGMQVGGEARAAIRGAAAAGDTVGAPVGGANGAETGVAAGSEARLAAGLADAAGRLLLALRDLDTYTDDSGNSGNSENSGNSGNSGDADGGRARGKEAGARGDRAAHEFLAAELARLRPEDAVLSEEGADDTARLTADRVWIVDPLDGTREYGEPGRTDWAVHVALWSGGGLVAGAVALPARDQVMSSAVGGHPALPPRDADAPIRLAVSRSRPPALLGDLAAALGAETVPMGSAGVKAMSVLTGETDAYVHAGGQYEWDSAAPVAVAAAAGLHTSRLDGSPLGYNRPDPKLPDLVICRPELAETILTALKPLLANDDASSSAGAKAARQTWRPAPAARWVEAVNRGAIPLLDAEYAAPLDADQLLGEARAATGLDDFGDFDGTDAVGAGFETALRVLVDSLESEGRLNLLGRYEIRQQILRLLHVRLQLARYVADDPGVLDEPVTAPLFVTGAPRTGTSILHALLARDPANRVPQSWEFLRPVPPPDPATYDDDPRIALVDRELRLTAMIAPGFDAMHERGARLPKECISAQAIAFRSEDFPGKFRVPSYASWLAACDMGPAYRAHRVVLQILQRRFGPQTRWVLKAPPHLGTLDALFATYPDARIAVTHRDPLRVLGSLSSLLATIHATHSDDVDAAELARTQVDFYADVLARYTDLRRTGSLDAAEIHDSHYADFMRDAVDTVAGLYTHFDRPLDADVRRAMADYLAARPRGKHGKHAYALADFGLDAAELRERFADYQEFFAVPTEGDDA